LSPLLDLVIPSLPVQAGVARSF